MGVGEKIPDILGIEIELKPFCLYSFKKINIHKELFWDFKNNRKSRYVQINILLP